MMEQGPTEKAILEQCYRYRQPVPEKIQNAPTLLPGLEFYYAGFQDLHTCRSGGGMGEGPISWFARKKYCREIGLDGEDADDFVHLIGKMDEAYRKHQAKKHESAQATQRKANKRRR